MTYAAGSGPSGWAWVAMAVSVVLLAALSVGAYLLLFRGGSRPPRRTSAERRLADQVARGQITEEEYLHLMAALESSAAGGRRRPRKSSTSRGRLPRSR